MPYLGGGWRLLQQRGAQLVHERQGPLPRWQVVRETSDQYSDASQGPARRRRTGAAPRCVPGRGCHSKIGGRLL